MNKLLRDADRSLRTLVPASIIAALTSGCCYFAPCHRGTGLIGTVTNAFGQPVPNATVTLYGHKLERTDRNGCVKMRSPDATPFTLTVQAPGYKPFSSEVRYGRFRVAVVLQNETSSTENTISWAQIDEGEFMGANCDERGRADVKSTTG